MNRIFLKPVPGAWRFGLPPEGAWRDRSNFWIRRVIAGEVVEAVEGAAVDAPQPSTLAPAGPETLDPTETVAETGGE